MKQDGKSRQQHGTPVEAPHLGTRNSRPLDGSQYRDVIEEQRHAERRPTPDAREAREAEPKPDTQITSPQNTPTGN